MTAILLIARDTVRSIRRRRVLLAVLLLCLGLAGALTTVMQAADQQVREQAARQRVRTDDRRATVEQQLAAKRTKLQQVLEQARRERDRARKDLHAWRDFHASSLEVIRTPGATLYGRGKLLSGEEIRALPAELAEQGRRMAERPRQARDFAFQTVRREAKDVRALERELADGTPENGGEGARRANPDTDRLTAQAGAVYAGFFNLALSFGGALLALVLFCTGIPSELQSGTIRVTLSKPVSRTQFLLGKCLGATAVLLAYTGLTGVVAGVFGLMHAVPVSSMLAYGLWLAFCGNLMLGAVGLVFSLLVRPAVAGVLAWFTSAGWFAWFTPLYAVLPSYDPFQAALLVFGRRPDATDVLLSSLYAADLIAILIVVALYRFRRMELVAR